MQSESFTASSGGPQQVGNLLMEGRPTTLIVREEIGLFVRQLLADTVGLHVCSTKLQAHYCIVCTNQIYLCLVHKPI